jgi:hypothetical protein
MGSCVWIGSRGDICEVLLCDMEYPTRGDTSAARFRGVEQV